MGQPTWPSWEQIICLCWLVPPTIFHSKFQVQLFNHLCCSTYSSFPCLLKVLSELSTKSLALLMKLLWYSRYNQPPHCSLSALSSAWGMPAHVISGISLTSLSSPGMPLDWDSVPCLVPFTVSSFLYLYSFPLIPIWSVTPTSRRYAIKILLLVEPKFMAPNTWTWKKNIFPKSLLLPSLLCSWKFFTATSSSRASPLL